MLQPPSPEPRIPAPAVLAAMSGELAEIVRLLRRYECAAAARDGAVRPGMAGNSALSDLQSLDLAIQMAADLERVAQTLAQALGADVAAGIARGALAAGLKLERTLRAVGAAGHCLSPSAGPPALELFNADPPDHTAGSGGATLHHPNSSLDRADANAPAQDQRGSNPC